jgi:hypothetical protein
MPISGCKSLKPPEHLLEVGLCKNISDLIPKARSIEENFIN